MKNIEKILLKEGVQTLNGVIFVAVAKYGDDMRLTLQYDKKYSDRYTSRSAIGTTYFNAAKLNSDTMWQWIEQRLEKFDFCASCGKFEEIVHYKNRWEIDNLSLHLEDGICSSCSVFRALLRDENNDYILAYDDYHNRIIAYYIPKQDVIPERARYYNFLTTELDGVHHCRYKHVSLSHRIDLEHFNSVQQNKFPLHYEIKNENQQKMIVKQYRKKLKNVSKTIQTQ